MAIFLTTDGNSRHFSECGLDGVHGPLTEEQRELAARYLPLAHQLAQRRCTTWPTNSEGLYSTARRALVGAARTYDPSRKVGFGNYARHRIRAALRDFSRLYSACTARPS